MAAGRKMPKAMAQDRATLRERAVRAQESVATPPGDMHEEFVNPQPRAKRPKRKLRQKHQGERGGR